MSADWFPFRVKRAAPASRLVCFPPAGKGGSVFRTWQPAAPEAIEVLAVQLPGRETRMQAPPIDDVDRLADKICEALVPFLRHPLALFGHCYGAVVAFEVARRLPEDFVAMLCVSSCRAPHMLSPAGWSAGRPSFVDKVEIVRDAYGDKVADLPAELLEELMPGLLADLVALGRYRCEEPVELACPIHLFVWEQDLTVSRDEVQAWQHYTTARFTTSTVNANREELAPEGATITHAVYAELTRADEQSRLVHQAR